MTDEPYIVKVVEHALIRSYTVLQCLANFLNSRHTQQINFLSRYTN